VLQVQAILNLREWDYPDGPQLGKYHGRAEWDTWIKQTALRCVKLFSVHSGNT